MVWLFPTYIFMLCSKNTQEHTHTKKKNNSHGEILHRIRCIYDNFVPVALCHNKYPSTKCHSHKFHKIPPLLANFNGKNHTARLKTECGAGKSTIKNEFVFQIKIDIFLWSPGIKPHTFSHEATFPQ